MDLWIFRTFAIGIITEGRSNIPSVCENANNDFNDRLIRYRKYSLK